MKKLHQRIVGQDHVLTEISGMLKTVKADIGDPQRPLYVGFLVGPTGVGKTELVRVLAEAIQGHADAFCRIDMNTLAQDHYAAAITGAPPGYVGSKEGNSVIDIEKAQGSYGRPGIVLLDEIEKAGPQVVRALLNVIETGQLRLTSGAKTIDFRNSLIFMTSNLGAKEVQAYETRLAHNWRRLHPGALFLSQEKKQRKVKRLIDTAMHQHFDPEFINRFDQILLFNRIEESWLDNLIDIELDKLNARLARHHCQIHLDSSARSELTKAYDPQFGARSIRRACRQHLELAVADFLLRPTDHPINKMIPLNLTVSVIDDRWMIELN